MDWKDITIRQWQDKLYPITSRKIADEADELDQAIDILVELNGNTREYYDSMLSAEFYELFKQYEFILALPKTDKVPQFIEHKGYKFACDYNPTNVKTKLRARDIIDLTTIGKDEKLITDNMHKIIGAYLVEGKRLGKKRMENDVKEELLKDVDMQTCWNMLGFFFLLLENCSLAILSYLKTLPKEIQEQYDKALAKTGDG
jgi:hypothetical protein